MNCRFKGNCTCGAEFRDVRIPMPQPTQVFIFSCPVCHGFVELRYIPE